MGLLPMPSPPSDDAHWFADEVQPHDAALRGWLRARFPALGDVEDIVQETYTRILQIRARDPLRDHAVKPLLFTTARNLALDELRRRQIVPMYALPDDGDAAVFATDAPDVAETVSRRQELALLAEAIQSLPPRCRQILTLRKIYGLPQKGRVHGVSPLIARSEARRSRAGRRDDPSSRSPRSPYQAQLRGVAASG
jgi:RNA polymerase sigma factor (sigma-70 family)